MAPSQWLSKVVAVQAELLWKWPQPVAEQGGSDRRSHFCPGWDFFIWQYLVHGGNIQSDGSSYIILLLFFSPIGLTPQQTCCTLNCNSVSASWGNQPRTKGHQVTPEKRLVVVLFCFPRKWIFGMVFFALIGQYHSRIWKMLYYLILGGIYQTCVIFR